MGEFEVVGALRDVETIAIDSSSTWPHQRLAPKGEVTD
jgi:hypothetical protein